jgi:hypothetical protein
MKSILDRVRDYVKYQLENNSPSPYEKMELERVVKRLGDAKKVVDFVDTPPSPPSIRDFLSEDEDREYTNRANEEWESTDHPSNENTFPIQSDEDADYIVGFHLD